MHTTIYSPESVRPWTPGRKICRLASQQNPNGAHSGLTVDRIQELKERDVACDNIMFRDGIGMADQHGDGDKKKKTFLLTVGTDAFQEHDLHNWMRGKPYLKELVAGESIDEAENTMDSDQRQIFAAISDEEMQEKFREMLQRTNQNRRLAEKLHSIQATTREIQTQLRMLSGLSQAEGSLSTSTRETSSKMPKFSWESRLPLSIAENKSLYSPVLENPGSIDSIFEKITELGNEENSQAEGRLRKLAARLDSYLSKCHVLKKSDKSYAEKIRKSISQMEEYALVEHGNQGLIKSGRAVMPGPYSQEKEGIQPFLQALMQLVGKCLEPPQMNISSPVKSSVRKEVPILQTQYRSKRFIDFMLSKDGVLFDDMIKIPMETKPGWRKGRNSLSLLDEGRDQVLSHLAQQLFLGFNFAGIGVPCHATGLVANMAGVRVIYLRYEKVGTEEAKLRLFQSHLLPLMSAANFDKWVKDVPQKGRDDLRKELYGENGNEGVEGNLPKGLCLLFNLMLQKSDHLQGFSTNLESKELGTQLGSGSTAVVFRRLNSDKEPDGVVKVSRYGVKQDIEHELEILQELTTTSSMNKHIPRIIDEKSKSIRVQIGSVWADLPAIRTKPEGTPASHHFSQAPVDTHVHLAAVLNGVGCALFHMHSKNIFHLDVSPKNIVFVDQEAVLIDYSLAYKRPSGKNNGRGKNLVKGFFGTPNYAHREIFNAYLKGQQHWKPAEKHDEAGLGFALAFFAAGSVRMWSVDHYPIYKSNPTPSEAQELKKTMDRRVEAATEVVDKRVGTHELNERIKRLILKDKE